MTTTEPDVPTTAPPTAGLTPPPATAGLTPVPTTTTIRTGSTTTTLRNGPTTSRPATTVAPAPTTTRPGTPPPTTTPTSTTTGASPQMVVVHARGPTNYGFSPQSFSVPLGSKVVVQNDSSTAAHTWTAQDGSFDSGTVSTSSSSGPITMTRRGTFNVYCTIHGARLMSGTITVT